MKILLTVTYYHPYVSGLSLAVRRWAEALSTSGETVSVLAMRHDTTLPLYERRHGVAVYRVPWIAKISKGFLSWQWMTRSFHLVRTHDVVVVNLPQFEGLIPAIAAKFRGKRLVSLYHCEVVLPSGFVHSVVQALLEVSNFITLLLSDSVITYTDDYARHSRLLRSLKALRRDIPVVPIVPPITKARGNVRQTNEFRKKIGTPDVVVGVAARLAQEKGIEYLLDAIPVLSSVMKQSFKLVIAGPMAPVGEDAYRRRILSLVKKYKTRVIFLGEISPEHMGSFYQLLDVLVLSSVNSTEAFGMVQVEAMLWGVPVIATDLPGVRVPVQKSGMGIIVPPRDSRALAEAVVRISISPDSYRKNGDRIDRLFSERRSVAAMDATLR